MLDAGDWSGAADCFRQALALDPDQADALINLGFVLLESGQPTQAELPLRRAVVLLPESADANYLLGAALLSLGDPRAVAALARSIELAPSLLVARRDLGRALFEQGRLSEAAIALRAGIAQNGDDPDLHQFLGNVQQSLMEFDAAIASYRRALELQPRHAPVLSNLSQALVQVSDFEGAVDAARKAVALDPSLATAHSNLLLTLSCDARCDPQDYLEEARAYGQTLAAAAPAGASPLPAIASPKALRIGFVSGDLHSHPVGYFLDSVMAHWGTGTDLQAVAFSNHPRHDTVTDRLRQSFHAWHEVHALSDAELARLIAAQRIDVLVDLSGHTPGNRLGVFASRQAPVQVTWLGYWASTGLATMDYLLADPVSVPPETRSQFCETVWYLPQTRFCFTAPSSTAAPEPAESPVRRNGHVTFGSFQRLTKLNASVLALWSRVLKAVPGSHLRIQAKELATPASHARLLQRFSLAGIPASRIELVGPSSRETYFAAHSDVDILLDTFPHAGATTTCEALWMGVPTITLSGNTMLARQGASLLQCCGLPDWIAADADAYVELAARHAADQAALVDLRTRLRSQVRDSPLFDAAAFAQQLQQSFRDMCRHVEAHRGLVPPDL